MYLIVGLGNPGARYHNTRHNAGFFVIDKLAEFFKIESFEFEDNYLYAVIDHIDSQGRTDQVVLMKPLTFMNLSGKAVKEFYDRYEISMENILIVYDDVNIDLGVLRLRPNGSDGGQNGIKSVMYEMGTGEISRLRVGIKAGNEFEKLRAAEGFSLADFVLSDFDENEYETLAISIETAKKAVLNFIEHGIKDTMNRFNGNVSEKPTEDTQQKGSTDSENENNTN
ncbi:MAG TPA: aminoacyl-tRNA hydrolase [Ignavibacteria bacterium]|nr:aminoacyl-tRNA hydrolase [Bacteroidota bacterium]HRE09527.1 aminoacyl-tRNA hydrolase [Ignavibacteria bacterium]HRF64453.1 aminoacyl-tRNA hydrolase [Ignavibacteria bacterium]HRJ04929.1 aminoacyl-tRNA hydrolase [Ignavibacteria bacterium]HRJ86799.1 aminoacyl-tRNA hydrolase [Ignavibacteria bacterium]